jgi:hypothetical protein
MSRPRAEISQILAIQYKSSGHTNHKTAPLGYIWATLASFKYNANTTTATRPLPQPKVCRMWRSASS